MKMLSASMDGFFCLASDGTIEECNGAFCRMMGYSREELFSMKYSHLAESETVERLHERLSESPDQSVLFAAEHRRKDGTCVDLEVSLARLRGSEFPHFVCFARDLSRRRLAEERPGESERKYQELAESLPQVVFETDVQGDITFVNNAAFRAFGYSPEVLEQGFNVMQTLVPEDRVRAKRNFRRSLAGEGTGPNEYTALRKDGTTFAVIVYSTPIIRDDEPAGLRGVMVDISDRKSAEKQLRRLSAAVEQSPVSVVITDACANIEYVNPKFTEVTGYAREEVIGKNPRILKSGETPPEIYSDLWGKISAGKEWRGELLNRRKNGELYWEFVSISPIKGTEGLITSYVGVKEEITERKRLQQQLIQAQKMEAVGRLAGGIAHDFNNLLTVITGYSDLLLSRLAPDSSERAELEEIRKAGAKAASLTSQLLAFSRKQMLKPVILNLNDSITNVLKMLRRLIGENVQVITALEPHLGWVRADPTHMEQVLVNLAVNARDAMPDGGTLTIRSANVELDRGYARAHDVALESGRYVMLAVSDTGFGMDAETRARIFEPFFTTKEAGKGTGLGLCTAYGIVKQSGGYIWVYSEPHNGTTFKIYLPRIEEIEPGALKGEETSTLTGNETILLVEDNEALLKLCSTTLREFGYTVVEAGSAEEALALSEHYSGPIQLLFTDVILPGTPGRSLAGHLTLIRPEMKVLYSSGYPDEMITRLGMLETGIEFLQKPFTPQALARKVREVLDSPACC